MRKHFARLTSLFVFISIVFAAVSLSHLFSVNPSPAFAHNDDNNDNHKITICHASDSNSNPYVVNTPNIQNDGSSEGDGEGETHSSSSTHGSTDGLGEGEGDNSGDALGDGDGEGLGEGLRLGEGDGLAGI